MSWVQVKSPNLNVPTSLGMCLKYVQDAFGSGWAGSYALQGWRDIVKKKHTNRNIPSGVYVPIWFEGYWNGVNYGHVAIYKDGIVYSSPYTNKTSHDQLGNIETVERVYGMKYIGWSEDIGGTTVIKKGATNMAIIQNQENWYGRCNDTHWRIRGRALTRASFKNFVGQDFLHFVEVCSDDPEAQRVQQWQELGKKATQDKWENQIHTLKKQVADLGKRPTQAQLDAANASVNKLQGDMAKATAEATQARKDAAESAKQLEKIHLETAQAEKEANNFLTALINAVRKMFGGK